MPAAGGQIRRDSTSVRLSKVVRLLEIESKMVVARGRGEAEERSCFMGMVSILQGEKVLKIHCTTM